MNKHAKNKWVKALRSGEYQQTRMALYDVTGVDDRPKGHCCLGVLVEELVPEFLVKGDFYGTIFNGDPLGYQSLIPDDLAVMFDLTEGDQERLASMNDHGSNFNVIADYIEREL